MLHDPSVTHPNLVKSQVTVGIGSVLGAKGWGRSWEVARESHEWPGFPGSPHPPCSAASLRKELSKWGLSVSPLPPQSGSPTAGSQVAGERHHHWSSNFETKTEKFKTFLHSLIVDLLRIRSLSCLPRLNTSCFRGIHFIFQNCSLWGRKVCSVAKWKRLEISVSPQM